MPFIGLFGARLRFAFGSMKRGARALEPEWDAGWKPDAPRSLLATRGPWFDKVRGVAEDIAVEYKVVKNSVRPGETASKRSSKFGSIFPEVKASKRASGGEERIHWIAR